MNIVTKVKKPVEAIQCANTFGLLHRKMYNALLANAESNLCPNVTHRISIRVLCECIGYRSNDYKQIKEKFRELRRMDIEWDIVNDQGNKVWTNTSPLSLARIIEGEGICEYEFASGLIPYLSRPAMYARFSLLTQSKFKSSYGIALYENCERYRNIGYTRAFDIPTFRKLMGVGETEYLEFFSLKRRVIAIAIREVNQHADFCIEAEYEKKGRAVVTVKFLIKNKEIVAAIVSKKMSCLSDENDLPYKLKNFFQLQQKEVDIYLKKYGFDYIDEKVKNILNSDAFKNGAIKNMAGYLKAAISENFQESISSKSIIQKDIEAREIRSKKEERFRELEISYERYLSKEIPSLILKVKDDLRLFILAEFEKSLGSGAYLELFRKEWLKHVLVADRFIKFLKQKYLETLKSIMSLEEYLKIFHSQ